ncbi:glycosyltransferase family 39 protein [Actinoplanes sp. TFC3]|uniref:glycosyltransferase family 39 protein n=1 Tax=Actinoplanes sp. TFC3 TaxID=1710355 RepID=UPI0008374B32|nr:glycosyltransferase family 39 protein [Actinoplanes sp. TFC3]
MLKSKPVPQCKPVLGGPVLRSEPVSKSSRVWALPALTAACLGAWRLTGPALWADELATWGAVRLSWSQLWQLTGSVDAVLLPYYFLLKAVTSLAGTGTAALRLPSLAAVAVTAGVVAVIGRRLGGAGAGITAGMLFALLPVTSRYAQEARPYALTVLFAALALLFLIRLLEQPTRSRIIRYAAASTATGLLHPLSAVLMLVAHATAVTVHQLSNRRAGWRTTWLWAGAAFVAAAPVGLLSIRAAGQNGQVSWITLVDAPTLEAVPQHLFASAAVGGIVLALAVLGVRRGMATLCVTCAGFVPPVLLLIAGTQVPVWVARYVLLAVPALVVLAGAGAARAGRVQAGMALVVAVLLSYAMQIDLRSGAGHRQDTARIAQVIGPRYLAGDVAVFPDTHPSIPWAARDIYERYLPEPRPPDVLRITPQRTDGQFLATECLWAACLTSPSRIWIIRGDNLPDLLDGMPLAKRILLTAHYRRAQRWSYPMLTIVLLERKRR